MPERIAQDARIFVAGHRGLVGSAIARRLEREGFTNLLVAGREELDLRDQAGVDVWFERKRPEYVFLRDDPRFQELVCAWASRTSNAGATVGG